MKNLFLTSIALFFIINISSSQASISSMRLGLIAGKQSVDIKDKSLGTVSNKKSVYGEISLNSSIKLGRHSFIFGIGQRTQRTNIQYVTQKSSGSFLGSIISIFLGQIPDNTITPIYHAAERIELNNKYLIFPLGFEFILNKPTNDCYFYFTPQMNVNAIIRNQRSFHITTNHEFGARAGSAAERFKNIPFRSYVNCSLELGAKVKYGRGGFGGGLKYQSGNSRMYGWLGGIKPTVAVTLFFEYFLSANETSRQKIKSLED